MRISDFDWSCRAITPVQHLDKTIQIYETSAKVRAAFVEECARILEEAPGKPLPDIYVEAIAGIAQAQAQPK